MYITKPLYNPPRVPTVNSQCSSLIMDPAQFAEFVNTIKEGNNTNLALQQQLQDDQVAMRQQHQEALAAMQQQHEARLATQQQALEQTANQHRQQLAQQAQQAQQARQEARSDERVRTLPTFSSGKATDWRIFRKAFNHACQANRWGDNRRKMQLNGGFSILGRAAELAAELDRHVDNDDVSPRMVLDSLENIYITPAGQAQAIADFENFEQTADMTYQQMWAEMQPLFTRAYPDINDIDHCSVFYRRFLDAMHDVGVRRSVAKLNLHSVTEMKTAAELHATANLEADRHQDRKAGKKAVINKLSKVLNVEMSDEEEDEDTKVISAIIQRSQIRGRRPGRGGFGGRGGGRGGRFSSGTGRSGPSTGSSGGTGSPPKSGGGVDKATSRLSCWTCKEAHMQRECPIYKRAMEQAQRSLSRSGGRGPRQFGGRGRSVNNVGHPDQPEGTGQGADANMSDDDGEGDYVSHHTYDQGGAGNA